MSKRNGNGVQALKLDPHNARKHPDRNKAQIAASLKELGAGRSILVDATDTIIAGNGVYEQAQVLGYKVKVIEADGKTLIAVKRPDLKGAKARRMALADNRATETSEWDVDVLADLAANDADALAGLFDERELRDLLGDKMPGGKEETADAGELADKAAELQAKWQVCRGDVWQVGRHRVMCGDSTSAADVARLMGGERAQAVVTDPPFGVRDDRWDKFSGDDAFVHFTATWLEIGKQYADAICCFMADKNVPSLRAAMALAGLTYRRALIWQKPAGSQFAGASLDGFWYDFEIIQVFGKPQFKPRKDTRMAVLAHRTITNQEHGCEKPVPLLVDLIEGYSEQGKVVMDLFDGIGTTLVACEQTGRIGRGMEISEKYVAVSLERLSLMGLTPKRIDNGNGKAKRKTKATA